MKYEAVFGDQGLFEGMMPDCEFVDGNYGYKNNRGIFYYCERYNEKFGWVFSHKTNLKFRPIAMRRIIKEPKRWTWEDKKAGRLPEVGSVFTHRNETLTCLFIDADGEIWAHDINNRIVTPSLCNCYPLETPAEKAQRLREEWKNNAIEIHHGKRRKMSTSTFLLDDIYDALLSGELPMPNKESE